MLNIGVSNYNLPATLYQSNCDVGEGIPYRVFGETKTGDTIRASTELIDYLDSINNTVAIFQDSTSILNQEEQSISIENWLNLYMIFRDKFRAKSQFFLNATPEQVEGDFKRVAEFIFNLNPDVASVEVTNEEYIFIYAEFGLRNIFFNIFYDEEGSEILLNLIEEKRPVASVDSDIKSALIELEKFVYVRVRENYHAVSGAPNTEVYL